jgi:mRNA interferase MazF
VKGYPFEVQLPEGGTVSAGAILSDQVKSLSWQARNAAFAGKAPKEVFADVRAKLAALLEWT